MYKFWVLICCLAAGIVKAAEVKFPGKAPGKAVVECSDSEATLSNKMFSASFRKSGRGVVFGGLKLANGETVAAEGSTLFTITLANDKTYSSKTLSCTAFEEVDLSADKEHPQVAQRYAGKAVKCTFTTPDKALEIIWRAVLRNSSHYLRQELVIKAAKNTEFANIQALNYTILQGGTLELSGNTTHGKLVVNDSIFCGLETPMSQMSIQAGEAEGSSTEQVLGDWERRATLQKGQSWEVSSVLGFFAPQQKRRSFLAYSERERAASYRLFIHYNDWYEIGITVNNNADPLMRNSEKRQMKVLEAWRKEMFQKRKTPIDCFVIDDGWDDFNSLWGFHAGFPNGFANVDRLLRKMKSGLGTWLGPVGGYGAAKQMRLGYWNKNHPKNQISNFQLSNKEYFDAFVGRCSQMVKDYEMRYFKFDGISALPHAKGPANLEDAEGIIRVLTALRKARKDIFLNTTVGTWASPFWFHYSDCVWRQEADYDLMGSAGDVRDKWITYRDRLVHEVFVTGAPFFPINTIMTHGVIITRNTPDHQPKMSTDPANCVKEMRAAFGCGSGLIELYVDHDLMNQQDGKLWDELAACIKWARRNEDVLADTHWVGGNPWDRNLGDGDIYGWAAWNPAKCTLTLRNSSDSPKTLTSTLREILDVPPTVKADKVTFRSSFNDQRKIPGLVGKPVDIDKEISIALRPQEVVVLEGICAAGAEKEQAAKDDDKATKTKAKKGKKKKKKAKKA